MRAVESRERPQVVDMDETPCAFAVPFEKIQSAYDTFRAVVSQANPSSFGIVAMLPCAASRGTGMKGALGTNGTNREIPVDRARKT